LTTRPVTITLVLLLLIVVACLSLNRAQASQELTLNPERAAQGQSLALSQPGSDR
jgi:hypothetical protein